MDSNPSALKKSLVVLALLVPIAGALGFFFGKTREQQRMPRPVQVAQRGQDAERPRSPVPLAPAVTPAAEEQSPPPAPLPAVCAESWRTVAATDLPTLELDLLRRSVWIQEECLQRMIQEIPSASVRYFSRHCQLEIAERIEEHIQRICIPRVRDFRAYISWAIGSERMAPATADLDLLYEQLKGNMMNLSDASPEDLDRILRMAAELVAREPDAYGAYKAMLLAHVLKEVKFRETVDPAVYDQLYQELLSFELSPAPIQAPSPLASAELSAIDRDLIHLPFLRLQAMGDAEGIRDLASEYVNAYPDSYIGYYYLADLAWRAGETEQAMQIFRQGLGAGVSDAAAAEIFTALRSSSPIDRILSISIE